MLEDRVESTLLLLQKAGLLLLNWVYINLVQKLFSLSLLNVLLFEWRKHCRRCMTFFFYSRLCVFRFVSFSVRRATFSGRAKLYQTFIPKQQIITAKIAWLSPPPTPLLPSSPSIQPNYVVGKIMEWIILPRPPNSPLNLYHSCCCNKTCSGSVALAPRTIKSTR